MDQKFPLYIETNDSALDHDWIKVYKGVTLQGRSFRLPSDVPEAVFEYCRDLKVKLSKSSFSAAVDAVCEHSGAPLPPASVLGSYHSDLMEALQ